MKWNAINILLVNANSDQAISTEHYLAQADIVCDYACRSTSVVNLLKCSYYAAIVIDLDCKSFDGIRLCRTLRSEGIDVPVLMTSNNNDLTNKERAFDAGTDDYLVKPFAMKELELRIKALSSRRSGQLRKLKVDDLELCVETKQVVRGGKSVKLTPTNLKLLELLMRKSPKVISRNEILDEIWPEGSPDSDNLKVQLYQLRNRIDKAFGSQLIQTVTGCGVRIVA